MFTSEDASVILPTVEPPVAQATVDSAENRQDDLWSRADRSARNDQGRGICHPSVWMRDNERLLRCIANLSISPLDARDAFGDTPSDLAVSIKYRKQGKPYRSNSEEQIGSSRTERKFRGKLQQLACGEGICNMMSIPPPSPSMNVLRLRPIEVQNDKLGKGTIRSVAVSPQGLDFGPASIPGCNSPSSLVRRCSVIAGSIFDRVSIITVL